MGNSRAARSNWVISDAEPIEWADTDGDQSVVLSPRSMWLRQLDTSLMTGSAVSRTPLVHPEAVRWSRLGIGRIKVCLLGPIAEGAVVDESASIQGLLDVRR